MFDFEETADYYNNSYTTNKLSLKYLRRCRIALAKVAILNIFFDLADPALVREARDSVETYIGEVKDDRFYLKLISRIIKKLYINGVDEFEYDLVALLKCIELKDANLAESQDYYVEKIKSHVNNYYYTSPKIDDRLDEYNGKITELVKRLHQNALDYKE